MKRTALSRAKTTIIRLREQIERMDVDVRWGEKEHERATTLEARVAGMSNKITDQSREIADLKRNVRSLEIQNERAITTSITQGAELRWMRTIVERLLGVDSFQVAARCNETRNPATPDAEPG